MSTTNAGLYPPHSRSHVCFIGKVARAEQPPRPVTEGPVECPADSRSEGSARSDDLATVADSTSLREAHPEPSNFPAVFYFISVLRQD